MVVGWGIPAVLISVCVACNYEEYGGEVNNYVLSHGIALDILGNGYRYKIYRYGPRILYSNVNFIGD